jgi:8-oxo-dGTP diphosphatase
MSQIMPVSGPLLIVVAAALVDEQAQVLVQQRPLGSSMAGLWEFPGGKVEPGETPEVALVRELREELAIDVETDSLVPAAFASEPLDGKHLLLLLYIIRKWSGTAEPLHASALQWLAPVALHDIAMPPADGPLVTILAKLLASQ